MIVLRFFFADDDGNVSLDVGVRCDPAG